MNSCSRACSRWAQVSSWIASERGFEGAPDTWEAWAVCLGYRTSALGIGSSPSMLPHARLRSTWLSSPTSPPRQVVTVVHKLTLSLLRSIQVHVSRLHSKGKTFGRPPALRVLPPWRSSSRSSRVGKWPSAPMLRSGKKAWLHRTVPRQFDLARGVNLRALCGLPPEYSWCVMD